MGMAADMAGILGRNLTSDSGGRAAMQSQPTYREEWNARRGIDSSAAFFAPYLAPGMWLLDAGCGPGSLTVDLAQAVTPGTVVALDEDERVVRRAESAAREHSVSNARFVAGDAYRLPFEDKTFDAVWTSSLVQWLREPAVALREMARVLKPGGVYASRDRDRRGDLFGNPNSLVRRAADLHYRQNEAWTGGDFRRGSKVRGLMLQAGFENVITGASYENHSGPDGTRFIVGLYDRALRHDVRPRSVEMIKERGWADDHQLTEMLEAWRRWADDPRSFFAICRVENIGWKPAAERTP
jgi:ubiquinone/menaquinone biosynthesis C-methylase UbiE